MASPVLPRPPCATRALCTFGKMASSGEEGAAPARGEGSGAEGAQAPAIKVRYCAVYDCTNNHKSHPDLAYFGFPNDKARIKQWVEKIRRPDILQPDGRVSTYYRVCEMHFLPRHINVNRRRRRLMKRAVPTLRLPHPGSYVNVYEPPTQGNQPVTQLQIKGKTLKKSTLEVFEYVDNNNSKLTKKRKKVVLRPPPPPVAAPPPLEDFFADCDWHLPPNTSQFFKLVTRLQSGRNSYDTCVKLLHSSPQAYRLLQATLGLPTVSVLHRHCARRLHDFDTTLELLKTRVDRMTQIEKQCSLSVEFIDTRPNLYYNITFDRIVGFHEVDGVQIPSVAKRGMVVVARGLLANWRQPVALCYLARDDDAVDQWIDKIIRHLLSIGLKIHALVCDPMSPPLARNRLLRDVSTDQPFFHIDDTKIYLLFDPPRLMKMLFCDFMTYDFCFERKRAKWSDVLEYRKIELNKRLTLTPELTDSCVNPLSVRRMRAARAARILSSKLATALDSRVDQGLLPDTARATVNFILKINNIYNVLDSTKKRGTYFKKGLYKNSSQIDFLVYMKSFFRLLKLEDNYGLDQAATKKHSESWQITIGAVLGLNEDLQPLRPYLLTMHLHLVDSVGESARQAAGNSKPSCRQIFAAFKKQFLLKMQQPPGKERSVDLNTLLAQVVSDASAGAQHIEVDDEIKVQASDYRSRRLPKRHSLAAAAKHLLRAASRVHGDCQLAAAYLSAPPQPDFLQLVTDLDEALTSALSEGVTARSLLRDLLLDVHVLDCELPCECFPLDYLKRLFFRLRLYRILRQNQKRFKSGEEDIEINSLQ